MRFCLAGRYKARDNRREDVSLDRARFADHDGFPSLETNFAGERTVESRPIFLCWFRERSICLTEEQQSCLPEMNRSEMRMIAYDPGFRPSVDVYSNRFFD